LSNIVIIEVEPSLQTLFDEQLQSISQLIGTKKIESISVTTKNTEEGYAVSTVSSEINVLLLVKGRVDLASHLERTKEKLIKSQEKLSKLKDQIGAAGYKDKVDSDVKEADDERLRNLTAEVETLDTFVESLKKLTLE
jgi:valyl-tRNA synthetase